MLEVKNEGQKWRNILLCCTESGAFETISNAIVENGNITYEDLRELLSAKYCGAEYKRTLEAKLRSLSFVPGQNIPAFSHELKSIVKELYGVTDNSVIESIAQNHILGKLDITLQEPAKLLQLTGTCTVEGLLELVNSKAGNNAFQHPMLPSAMAASAIASRTNGPEDRIGKLETMVEKLYEKVASLSNEQNGTKSKPGEIICYNCGNPGHTKFQCYKLKTCLKCNKKGHIAKHCRTKADTNNSVATSTGRVNQHVSGDKGTDLDIVPRIMLQTNIGGQTVNMLYDPGSMYSMPTRDEFNKLPHKPPLVPVNRCGIGVPGEKFQFDGVAHLNIEFKREDGTTYTLQYQPLLVSSKITTNILGMQTELQFKGAVRDQENRLLTFIPKDSDNITVKYWKEALDTQTAFVQVAKTTIIPTNGTKFVHSKLTNEPKYNLIEHEIKLKDHDPVSIPARRLPYSQRKEIEQQVQELQKRNIIEPSRSTYASPVVPVKKKDGSLRMCVDYRALNAKTIPGTFPIPRIDESLDKLHGVKYFTVLDLKSGYHHIPIAEEDQMKTAFVLPGAKYATLHDKKVVQDDKLSPSDHVYLFLPRLARVKLARKWHGPFKIARCAHPVYSVEVPTAKGIILRTVTRDKLKRASPDKPLQTFVEENRQDNSIESAREPLTSDSDDEEEPRYQLRPRRNIIRYNQELVSFLVAFR